MKGKYIKDYVEVHSMATYDEVRIIPFAYELNGSTRYGVVKLDFYPKHTTTFRFYDPLDKRDSHDFLDLVRRLLLDGEDEDMMITPELINLKMRNTGRRDEGRKLQPNEWNILVHQLTKPIYH